MNVLVLWLPIALSAIALFFTSFLSWMVLQLHKGDWKSIAREDELLEAARKINLAPGNYMFPACQTATERNSPDFKEKWERGPKGVMTVFSGSGGMGQNLALTMLYFLVTSFCIAYLATLALKPGAPFLPVFRFVSTAGLLVYLSAIVQHAIWFRIRIIGHVIETIVYATIIGAIFGALWPG